MVRAHLFFLASKSASGVISETSVLVGELGSLYCWERVNDPGHVEICINPFFLLERDENVLLPPAEISEY